MSLRLWRSWLTAASGAIFALSALLLAWAAIAPCAVEVAATSDRPARHVEPKSEEADEAIAWDTFDALCERRFQRSLYDRPPPEPPPVIEKVLAPPRYRLLATMAENNGGSAVFADPAGTVVFKPLGSELVDGESRAELVEISSGHVVLLQGDQRITLKLSQE